MRGNFAAPNGDYYTQVSLELISKIETHRDIVLAHTPRRFGQLPVMRRMFRTHSDIPEWDRLCGWRGWLHSTYHP